MSEQQSGADQALADEWAAALDEQATDASAAPAESAQFQELQPDMGGMGAGDVKIDAILDVPVTVAMEIGRARINIRNLLQLNQGSVVGLDRLAGEPLDVLVNGTLIAQGEVVVTARSGRAYR